MKEKNFVPHTRPGTEHELVNTIRGLRKQVRYMESTGGNSYDITYYKRELKHCAYRLKTRFGKVVPE